MAASRKTTEQTDDIDLSLDGTDTALGSTGEGEALPAAPNPFDAVPEGVEYEAVGDAIAIHPVGIIGMVYDHRAFDGSTASKFLLHLRDSLEQRDWAAELV